MYFCVITMTTVGYGDQMIKLTMTKIVTSICAIAGTILLAIPISVFSTNFDIQFQRHSRVQDMEEEKLMQAQLNEALHKVKKDAEAKFEAKGGAKLKEEEAWLGANEKDGADLGRVVGKVAENAAMEAAAVVDGAMGREMKKGKARRDAVGSVYSGSMLEYLQNQESEK